MNARATHMSLADVAALLEERDMLREALRQAEEQLAPTVIFPASWHLTRSESDVLQALRGASPNVCHRDRIFTAMYGLLAQDLPDPKTIDVFVCTLRRKLTQAQAGVHVETAWGRGYRLSPESLARLNDHIDATSRPVAWPRRRHLAIAGAA